MPYQPFTLSEVKLIFELSEGERPALGEGGTGHAGARHVGITNEGLAGRLRGHRGGGLAAYTAFHSFHEQVQAALLVLNAPENAADLEHFRVQIRPGGRYELVDRATPHAFRLRYGTAGGGGASFPCSSFTQALRKDLSRPRGMHIVTFFGTMGTLV